MLKKTINYVDYDGNQVSEEFTFNLNQAELAKLQLSTSGGVETMINNIIKRRDGKQIMDTIEAMILMSYGEKSADGKRFIKSREMSEEFKQTEAYSVLFMELISDAKHASEFFNGVVPPEVAAEVEKQKSADGLPKLTTIITPPTEADVTDDGK